MIITRRKFIFKTAEVIDDMHSAWSLAKREGYDFVLSLTHEPVTQLGLIQGWHLRQKETTVIDLTKGVERVFVNFNDTARNEIRRSEREAEFDIKYIEDAQTSSELFGLYEEFEEARGAKPMPLRLFKELMALTASIDGRLVSAITFYPSLPIIRIRSIFSMRHSTPEQRNQIGRATRRLVWELCRWGMENRATGVDLAGINRSDPAKAGITQFKLSFGGKIVEEYVYTWKSRRYILFERLKRFLRH